MEEDILEPRLGRVMWRGHGVSEWLDFLEIQGDLAAQGTGFSISRGLGTALPPSYIINVINSSSFSSVCHSCPCGKQVTATHILRGEGQRSYY